VNRRTKFSLAVVGILIAWATAQAGTSSPEVSQALAEIEKAYAQVPGFQAEVTTRHQTQESDVVATRVLTVSKKFGWKIVDWVGDQRREIINDFRTNYVYLREQKKVLKLTATSPELEQEFRKPVVELNPVFLLDRNSLRLVSTEEFEGEPVYHFSGTTTTQMMQRGKPVTVEVDAWVSRHDGIPRKTVEKIGNAKGTTIYRRVSIRPDLTAEDFHFQKPQDVAELSIPLGEAETVAEEEKTTGNTKSN